MVRVAVAGWLALLLILGAAAHGQSVDPRLEAIDQYAAKVQAAWKVPGLAMAIVQDGRLLFAKGYGVRRLGETAAVDADTLFAIASNSKAFTTAALAILVDEGKLKWDDPVRKYLPEFQLYDPFVSEEMTVRDLVCHRCGLATFSGDLLWYETNYTADEILRRAQKLQPTASFRSKYGYQNLMYIAAGRVIERVSGKTWAEFVDERILTPLGMERTTTSTSNLPENVATPHNGSGSDSPNSPLRPLPPGNVDNCWGACGLNASVNDLSRWMRCQLGRGTFEGKQIFSREQSWEMWQPQIMQPVSEGQATDIPSRHFRAYGLGWVLFDYQGVKVVNHSGGLDGMISQTALVPERNLGVVVLTNSESPASSILMYKVLDTLLGVTPERDWNAEGLARQAKADAAESEALQKLVAARIPNAPPTLPLEAYAGTYRCPMYGDVIVSVESGKLVLKLAPAPRFVADLEPWHYNTFRIHWRESVCYDFPPGFVTFTLSGSGKTDELIIDQPNNDFWFYELKPRRLRD